MKSFFAKAGNNNAPESVTPTFFTSSSTSAMAMTPFSTGKHVVYFTPTQDCYLRFGTSSVGAASSSHWPLIANKRVRIIISNDSNYFTVIRKSADGLLYWYVSGETEFQTSAQILGSNLIDEWNSDSATANSWVSSGGRTVTKSGTPTYGADGSRWGLHNVVGTLTAGPDYYNSGNLSGLPLLGTTPYVYALVRLTSASTVVGSFGTAAASLIRFYHSGGNINAAYGSTSIVLAAESSVPTLLEVWSTGTTVNGSINGGTTVSSAAVETLSANIVRFTVGNKNEASDGPYQGFHARWGICTTVPSDVQRATLLNTFRRIYGF